MISEVSQQPTVLAGVRKYYASLGAIPIKTIHRLVTHWPPTVVFTGMGSSLFAAYPAQAFLTFVLSEPMQRKAFTHGFRPANVNIPIRDDPESPFVRQKERGLMLDIGQICDPGDPKAMDELLKLWDRSR